MRKYSSDVASMYEWGGIMQWSALISVKRAGSAFLGSATALLPALKTLKVSPTRMS